MLDEHVPFLEGAGVEEQLQSLARGELALGVLRLDATLAAAGAGGLAHILKPAKNLLHQPFASSPRSGVKGR